MNGRVGILGDLHSEDLRLKVALDFFENPRSTLLFAQAISPMAEKY